MQVVLTHARVHELRPRPPAFPCAYCGCVLRDGSRNCGGGIEHDQLVRGLVHEVTVLRAAVARFNGLTVTTSEPRSESD